ncbi:MAG: thiamine pyrophosphate-binding protein [Arhodomonas sp.]|nr:thiamine pyrophosphate-binding protein [Arhodomonas sp.]
MSNTTSPRTGGQILVDTLRLHGADRIFCVPGESYLAVLDALLDAPDIAVTVCRQESGAAMMADAYARCTGRPGVCFVTRGPGATNASAGLHIAQQDSTPVILFIGQIRRDTQEREAFQEIDYRRMLGPLTKWTAQIDDTARIPEMVSRAYHNATAGRPGPVALALPEDMLTETAAAPVAGPWRPGDHRGRPGGAGRAARAPRRRRTPLRPRRRRWLGRGRQCRPAPNSPRPGTCP